MLLLVFVTIVDTAWGARVHSRTRHINDPVVKEIIETDLDASGNGSKETNLDVGPIQGIVETEWGWAEMRQKERQEKARIEQYQELPDYYHGPDPPKQADVVQDVPGVGGDADAEDGEDQDEPDEPVIFGFPNDDAELVEDHLTPAPLESATDDYYYENHSENKTVAQFIERLLVISEDDFEKLTNLQNTELYKEHWPVNCKGQNAYNKQTPVWTNGFVCHSAGSNKVGSITSGLWVGLYSRSDEVNHVCCAGSCVPYEECEEPGVEHFTLAQASLVVAKTWPRSITNWSSMEHLQKEEVKILQYPERGKGVYAGQGLAFDREYIKFQVNPFTEAMQLTRQGKARLEQYLKLLDATTKDVIPRLQRKTGLKMKALACVHSFTFSNKETPATAKQRAMEVAELSESVLFSQYVTVGQVHSHIYYAVPGFLSNRTILIIYKVYKVGEMTPTCQSSDIYKFNFAEKKTRPKPGPARSTCDNPKNLPMVVDEKEGEIIRAIGVNISHVSWSKGQQWIGFEDREFYKQNDFIYWQCPPHWSIRTGVLSSDQKAAWTRCRSSGEWTEPQPYCKPLYRCQRECAKCLPAEERGPKRTCASCHVNAVLHSKRCVRFLDIVAGSWGPSYKLMTKMLWAATDLRDKVLFIGRELVPDFDGPLKFGVRAQIQKCLPVTTEHTNQHFSMNKCHSKTDNFILVCDVKQQMCSGIYKYKHRFGFPENKIITIRVKSAQVGDPTKFPPFLLLVEDRPENSANKKHMAWFEQYSVRSSKL